MDGATQALVDHYGELLGAACEAGRQQLLKAQMDPQLMPVAEQFRYERHTDPFSQQPTLNGHWGESGSQRRASLVINADGSVLLECDLLCAHPGHAGRWAEQVSVWGRPDALKAEISLLAELGD